METDTTIEKIKAVEDWGKKKLEETEAKKLEISQKARERGLILVEEFERSRENDLGKVMSKVESETGKEVEKILAKSRKEADGIREGAENRTADLSRRLFDKFRKKLLL